MQQLLCGTYLEGAFGSKLVSRQFQGWMHTINTTVDVFRRPHDEMLPKLTRGGQASRVAAALRIIS